MSTLLLSFLGRIRKVNNQANFRLVFIASYSRKHDSKNDNSCYKAVKSNRNENDQLDVPDDGSTNWELLAPKGYRYILPGSTGLALQAPIALPYAYKQSKDFTFEVRECPLVLKNALAELFHGHVNQSSQTLTVITLRQRGKPQADHESIAMKFLQDGQSICTRLMVAGYWADFINPFSGKPHLSPVFVNSLYLTDSRFRCLGFEIKDKKFCTVVRNDQSLQLLKKNVEIQEKLFENKKDVPLRDYIIADSGKPAKFIGNLFTNAPWNLNFLSHLSKKKSVGLDD